MQQAIFRHPGPYQLHSHRQIADLAAHIVIPEEDIGLDSPYILCRLCPLVCERPGLPRGWVERDRREIVACNLLVRWMGLRARLHRSGGEMCGQW